jgi:hypothetical protein
VPVTYEKDIRPLLEANCTSCHYTGGIAPFPLDNWASVQAADRAIVTAVQNGKMPPWLADKVCHPLRNSAALPQTQIDLLASWQKDGFLPGNAADYKAPVIKKVNLGPPSIQWAMKDPYTTPLGTNDNYRCFVIPGTFVNDTYITAVNIQPGQTSTVHHVQVHTIPATSLAAAQQMDGADGSPGWSCSGGTPLPGDYNLFSWRPGTQTAVFEPGDAVLVTAGSAVVMQVHYNIQNILAGHTPPPDLSKVSFWTLPDGQLPDRIIVRRGLFGLISIPPGDANYSTQATYPMSMLSVVGSSFLAGEVVGETPHMHHLGTELSVTKTSGGASTCLINVPHWNFEWQMDYFYAPGTGVPFASGDSLTVRCQYDNSAANQPFINGVQLTPKQVNWGEGSYDEMCLNYTWLRYPRDAYLAALGK